jgi:hypothetical protein
MNDRSASTVVDPKAIATRGFLRRDARPVVQSRVPVQHRGSTAVTAFNVGPIKPKPAARGSALSPSTLGKGSSKRDGGWSCCKCQKALGSQSIIAGAAMTIDSQLFCLDCIKTKTKVSRPSNLTPRKIAVASAIGIAAMGLAALLYPGHVLFALQLLSVLASLIVLAGPHLPRIVRIGTLAVSALIAICSGFGIAALHQRAANESAGIVLAQEGQEIADDLKHNCFLNAQRRLAAIELHSAHLNGPGASATNAYGVGLSSLRAQLNAWLAQHYGQLSTQEHALLLRLFEQFGERTASGGLRFTALHVNGAIVQLDAASEPQPRLPDPSVFARCVRVKTGPAILPEHPSGDPAIEFAVRLVRFISEQLPQLEGLDLKLFAGDDERHWQLDQNSTTDIVNGNIHALSDR